MKYRDPTSEELEEFWKRFGFAHLPVRPLPGGEPHPTLKYWLYPDGFEGNELPPVNMSNLFKWCVNVYSDPSSKGIDLHIHFIRDTSYPEHINEVNCWFYHPVGWKRFMFQGWSYCCEWALFWAIRELIEKEKSLRGVEPRG